MPSSAKTCGVSQRKGWFASFAAPADDFGDNAGRVAGPLKGELNLRLDTMRLSQNVAGTSRLDQSVYPSQEHEKMKTIPLFETLGSSADQTRGDVLASAWAASRGETTRVLLWR